MTTPVEFVIQLALESAPELIEQTATANQAIDESIGEIQRIEQVMSEWQPHSEVSQINSAAGTGPVAISEELYRLLQMALQVSELSGGRFDITFRSAGKLWDFRHQIIPTQAQIEAAITAIDYHKVRLQQSTTSPTGYLAEITSANTSMGLGAIAKGYAIDRAVQVIRRAGFQQFVVNAGGDLYASSVPGQPLWQVGIQHPRQREQLIARLPVANMAVATSGDYERYFIHNGQRYSHLINPATGYPANGCQSVTIMASRGFWADALATAVFVMGPQEGMALVEQLDDVEAMVIDAAGIEHLSSGFTL
ncbi:FAD:protein FMN transferase [Candidatus Thalassolituus haligoni]|uniref:FAD:protein FMN transferase n=1 Tax=Candidatus Thalassolituus haligoni TaxID=3100113 RepID=UPI003513714D